MKAVIINEINKAKFYPIIMDRTQDAPKDRPAEPVHRYVTVVKNDMDIATDMQINEVFLGFEATQG